ncbi:MAG: hypothetical protein RIR00_716 [Pseudomonadota bacterium]|jgi:phospholipid transport system transporter-binding protein
MIDQADGRLHIRVPMTLANAAGLLQAGRQALGRGEQVIDLGAVAQADSSAVSLMLAWQRAAADLGANLRYANVPPVVQAMVELYDVDALIPRC